MQSSALTSLPTISHPKFNRLFDSIQNDQFQNTLMSKTCGYMKLVSIYTYLNYYGDKRSLDETLETVSHLSTGILDEVPTIATDNFDIVTYAHNQARNKYGIKLL